MRLRPDQKAKMLTRLAEYYGRLIDREFSGKVTMSFDRGFLQACVKRDETEKLEDVS